MTDATSEALLDSAVHGDELAMSQLLARHVPGLRAYVRLRMGPTIRAHESCSDIVQSVCREVIQYADRFQHGGENGFKRWLYRQALRKIADRGEFWKADKRDHRRAITPGADDTSPDVDLAVAYETMCSPSQVAVAREETKRLERAFDDLPDHYREVVIGTRLLGHTYAEVGEQIGRSEASVRMLLFRAMSQLSEKLGENE